MPKTRREIAREVDEILRSEPGSRTSKASHRRGDLVDFAARAKREVSSGTEHEIDLVVDAANHGYVTASQARIAIEWMARHGGRGTIAFGNEGLRYAGVDLDTLKTKMQGTAEQESGGRSRSQAPRGKISKVHATSQHRAGRGQVGLYGLTEDQIPERYRTFLREMRPRGGSISVFEMSRVIGDDPKAIVTTFRRMEQEGLVIGDPEGKTWHLLTPIHRREDPPKKGDRLDNFGETWRVLRVDRNRFTMAREVPDPHDRFNKVMLVDQREFHPHDIAHMRRL